MTLVVRVEWNGLGAIEKDLRRIGNQAPHAVRRGVNKAGDKGRTPYVRAIVKSVGAQRRAIVGRTKVIRANFSNDSTYTIRGFGGPIPLKQFFARETRAGVSATPYGKRQVIAGSFLKGGRFPGRVPISKFGGHVMQRVGSGRFPVKKVMGPGVPEVMLESPAIDVWKRTAEAALLPAILHEINAIVSGWAPRG